MPRRYSKMKKKRQMNKTELLLYILLLAILVAFALTKQLILSLFFIVTFVALLVEETKQSLKEEGIKKTAIDIAEAIAIVIAIWIIAELVLGNAACA